MLKCSKSILNTHFPISQFLKKGVTYSLLLVSLFACANSAQSVTTAKAVTTEKDLVIDRLLEWHLGFTTNQAQYQADKEAGEQPAWALSEMRLTQIWTGRDDGYWIYYEVSQPAVRPDRNEIWNMYRNDHGDMKVDVYRFNNVEAGLAYWGKSQTPEVFEEIQLDQLTTVQGCNSTFHWIPELNKFSGINSHYDCPVGNGYILQHIEITKDAVGTIQRNDWHWFFDGDGVAKTGPAFKLGNMGPYIHKYLSSE